MHNIYLFIIVTALMTYAMRVLPLTLIRKPIRSRFVRSFLFYVPYVTLAVMTFPAIIEATNVKIAGVAALLIGIIMAWKGQSLIMVAASCSLVVLLVELL
ncbi:MAG: AzlD domain-containing protein [Clostridiales bacterium]|nr:AzlD domain-containing protein [Clostridiales bacterium]